MENELKPLVTISTPNLANVAADSVTINWDYEIEGASPEDIRFEVAVKGEMADGTPWIRFEAPEKNTCTITGLKPDTKYSIFVVAIHENEDIAQAPDSDDGVVVTTSANTPPPAAPKKKPWKTVAIIIGSVLAGMALFAGIYSYIIALGIAPSRVGGLVPGLISDDIINILWRHAADNMTKPEKLRYQIQMIDESGQAQYFVTDEGEWGYTIRDVKPNCEYKICVRAIDKQDNCSEWSEELTVKTAVRESPVADNTQVLVYYNASEKKVDFSWMPATDNATAPEKMRYFVNRKISGTHWKSEAYVDGKTSCSIPVAHFSPPLSTLNTFSVDAIDEDGNVTRYDNADLRL